MSTTTTREEQGPATTPSEPSETRLRRIARRYWGPSLIVLLVTFAMRGFLFTDSLTNQHPDILSFWLPRYCFLGKSLLHGDIPLWNPLLQGGTPYVSDPQSGWMYLPAMSLFTFLPCGLAMRLLIAFNPYLAGLGLYWFLRKEGLSQPAGTAGGLSYAMILACSNVGLSMPFAGSLAWTPFVLVGASGYLSAARWSRRLAWLAFGAFAWGQVAGAHVSHGLAMCTMIVAVYLAVRALLLWRGGEKSALRAALLLLGFLAILPLANVATFLPRLALTPRTSLRNGYGSLDAVSGGTNSGDRGLVAAGVWAAWPLSLGATPGAYAGAAILLMVPAALRCKAKRHLVIAFFAIGIAAWLLTLNLFVQAGWFRAIVLKLPLGDFYLHDPGRLRLLMLVVVPVLGALGIQGFLDRPLPWRKAAPWIGAGLVLYLLLPLAVGAHIARFLLLIPAVLITIPVLLALGDRRRWAVPALIGLLALDLLGSAVYSQVYQGGQIRLGLEDPLPWIQQEGTLLPGPLRYPNVNVAEYLDPGTIGRAMQGRQGRFLTWAPPTAYYTKGYLFSQQPVSWPGMANGRGTLLGLEDSLGYNPVQLLPYWSYIRATNKLTIFYNASVIQLPTLANARLLGIRWLTVPVGIDPPLPATLVTRQQGWDLYTVNGWEARASVVPSWSRVADETAALRAVLEPGFDPAQSVITTGDPGVPSSAGVPGDAGQAAYQQVTPQEVRIRADAAAHSIVVIRNIYDGGWRANVDGRPAPVQRVDYALQGVVVPRGAHTIELTYHDPNVYRGLYVELVVWLILLSGIGAAVASERRR